MLSMGYLLALKILYIRRFLTLLLLVIAEKSPEIYLSSRFGVCFNPKVLLVTFFLKLPHLHSLARVLNAVAKLLMVLLQEFLLAQRAFLNLFRAFTFLAPAYNI